MLLKYAMFINKRFINLTPLFMESTFASRVRQYRQSKGLSQQAFAELCGLTQGNIGHMEGGTEPKQSNVSKLLAGLPDLNPDWLLNGVEPMLRGDRALTPAAPANQLPPVLPPAVREGLPAVPGTATPKEADFVGQLIARLEKELTAAQAREEYLQGLVTDLLGKSDDSADAAASMRAFVNPPRPRLVNMAPTPTRLAREAEQAAANTCRHLFVAQWGSETPAQVEKVA